MKPVQVSVTIEAPRSVVFDAFADFDQSARILHEAIRVDFKSSQKTGVGTEWEQERKSSNESSTIAQHRITAFNPPHSYVMTTDDRSSFETMTFEFSESGSATVVAFRVETELKSTGARLAAFFLGKLVKGLMLADLYRMKRHLEASSADSRS